MNCWLYPALDAGMRLLPLSEPLLGKLEVMGFRRGIVARKGPLLLERMCLDAPETPLDVPLHPAAEHVWRQRGYLS